MSITSGYFLLLVGAGVIVYYIFPKKIQWIILLALSIAFYFYATNFYTIGYLITSTLIAYVFTMWMNKKRKEKRTEGILVLAVVPITLNILIWFVVKGDGLWLPIFNKINEWHSFSYLNIPLDKQIIVALGMGYYTLQVIGYIIDCYWENVTPQKNPLKLFLFVAYFPQLTTGPISRYNDLKSLYEHHKFDYPNIAFGSQRVLWGFVKKLVLAERIGIIVSTINSNPGAYIGYYSWIVILLYPLQMYADFSGCMDIVLGISEMFGIKLAENFNNPFFARNSQEFWQRWHITLGTWAKDYVLYPLLKSKIMIKYGKFVKKKFGKRTGKFLVNLVGMFILWMVMGLWHGGWRYVIGVSLWYWFILMLGDLSAGFFQKMTSKMKMKTDSFAWHLFQSARTYVIYAIGASFFSMGISGAIYRLKDSLKVICVKDYANPWIFFDQSVLNLGVTWRDINIIIIIICLLLVVGILRERYGYARLWMKEQSFIFRWAIWIALFAIVLIYGKYGPEYNSTDFIYQGF